MAWLSALLLAWVAVLAAKAAVAATPGFEEDFTSGTGGFGGGSAVTQVLSGGVGGAADPYISISNQLVGNLGAFSSAPDLVGNLPVDGVTGYSFWLRDTGANDNHEIHVGVGNTSNFWLSIPGFVPPDGSWQQFSVDLTDPSQWVQILGTKAFSNALATSDRLLFRHDVPPLLFTPNQVAGDFGLDRVQVLPVPVPMVSAAGRGALALLLVALTSLGVHRRQRMHLAPS